MKEYIIDKKGIVRFIRKGIPENDHFLRVIEKLSKGDKGDTIIIKKHVLREDSYE